MKSQFTYVRRSYALVLLVAKIVKTVDNFILRVDSQLRLLDFLYCLVEDLKEDLAPGTLLLLNI